MASGLTHSVATPPAPSSFADYFSAQGAWAQETFGTERTGPVLAHVRKELAEIEADPDSIEEWCDAIALILNGARCRGFTVSGIMAELWRKLSINRQRKWAVTPEGTMEHVREPAPSSPPAAPAEAVCQTCDGFGRYGETGPFCEECHGTGKVRIPTEAEEGVD